MGSHGNDGHGHSLLTQQTGGSDAIHLRHLDIHHDKAVALLACHLHSLQAIFGYLDPDAGTLQTIQRNLAIDGIIFYQQDTVLGECRLEITDTLLGGIPFPLQSQHLTTEHTL